MIARICYEEATVVGKIEYNFNLRGRALQAA
jgi:hypothetical protein